MKLFKIVTSIITALTFFFAIFSVFLTAKENNLTISDVCFSSNCFAEFSLLFSGSIDVFKTGAYILWMFVVVYGLYIALNGYLNNMKSTALAGYIAHLRMFGDYVQDKAGGLRRINLEKIDLHVWYALAFPDAKNGNVIASEAYKAAISGVIEALNATNSYFEPAGERYSYSDHQARLIKALGVIGFNLSIMTKNDFYALEGEIISLLDSVNRTFAVGIPLLGATKRLYI